MDSWFESLIRPDLVANDYSEAANIAFNTYIKSRIAKGEEIYHLAFGQSPFPVLEDARQALQKHTHRNEYVAVQGIPDLCQSICAFHQRFDHVTFDPNNVVVGPGSKEMILLLLTVFGGDVLLNSPTWTTYKPQAILAGKMPTIVESSEASHWKVTPEALEKVFSDGRIENQRPQLLIFINPCNPTGVCYTEEELKALTQVFRKHRILVISDEIYARLRHEGKHICLAKVYPEGTILSTGMSKWASAGGWRIGYHIFPPELSHLMATVRSASSHSFSCAPVPMQFAFAEAFQNLDSCNNYIQHCSRILKVAANYTVKHLRSVGVSVVQPSGGYYCFPNFEVIRPALASRDVHTGKDMCELILRDIAVALLPGGPDSLRPATEFTVRLCFVFFDGKIALEESRRLGLETPLGEDFVEKFCSPVFKAISALKGWVVKLKQEQSSMNGQT